MYMRHTVCFVTYHRTRKKKEGEKGKNADEVVDVLMSYFSFDVVEEMQGLCNSQT
jgi:hypothetical protein